MCFKGFFLCAYIYIGSIKCAILKIYLTSNPSDMPSTELVVLSLTGLMRRYQVTLGKGLALRAGSVGLSLEADGTRSGLVDACLRVG